MTNSLRERNEGLEFNWCFANNEEALAKLLVFRNQVPSPSNINEKKNY